MGKTIHYLALLGVLISSQAFARSSDNPFDKVERIFAGAGTDWNVTDDKLRKTSGDESGTYYHLSVNRQSMRLVMSESADIDSAKSYKTLAIEDMKVDGKRLLVFAWCLQNQEAHNRFLQQGLSVKMQVCENRGEVGEFRLQVNDQTMQALEQGKRISFTIKPFRTAVEVNFDIENFADALAIMDLEKEGEALAAALAAPAVVAAAAAPPAVVKAQAVTMCDAKAPAAYASIKSVRYVCNDARDKVRAQKKVSVAVDKEKQRRALVKKQQQEQKRLAALAAQKKQQELEQQKQAEAKAIEASNEKYQLVLNDLTKKMLGVCNKMWDRGKHRCYCEKYIEHAPSSIESDPSCSI